MNLEDCEQYYEALQSILKEHQLHWVSQQVSNAIDAGKVVEHSSHGQDREPYTEQEKLLLLIDAIERTVVDTAQMEEELINFTSAESKRLNTPFEVKFISPNDREITLNSNSLKNRQEAIVELESLLKELREEVGVSVDKFATFTGN